MKYELDTDEKIIEKEAREYKKVSEERKKNIESILERSSKKRVVTLRLNNNDLEQIKSIANTEGIPYQTLISSILHKYINDRFVDKNEVFKISELLK
jgi:predicted DNA binding CopG/RHH family protein